jgi:hypothetical protein
MEKASGIKVVGRRALMGRGFLGSSLDKKGRWTDRYNRSKCDLWGSYDLIVVAAPRADKWFANQHPDIDRAAVEEIITALARADSRRVVLLSSIDAGGAHPYGQNRARLEEGMPKHASIIRLPALFGDGLKKNSLFDLLNNQPVANNVFHWYHVARLWEDVRKAQPGLWCPYSAPLSMWEIAERLGLTHLVTKDCDRKLDYNEKGPYTMSSVEVLEDIVRWATSASA